MRLSGTRVTAIASGKGFGNQLWDLAGTIPTLDLRLAENKSLVDATTGQQLVTFTRASSGTYVGADGLIKTATTNLLLRSEEFDDVFWTLSNATVSTNQATSPIGTVTADKLITNNAASGGQLFSTTTLLASTTYTFSCYAKAAEWSWLRLTTRGPENSDIGAYFNLATGTVGTTDANVTATIQNVSGGWYRCVVTRTTGTGATAARQRIYATNADNALSTGDGTSGIYIWGAQLEQSSTVGEYVPTTSTINSAPRFDHNPTTGESLGLLVEESRTNLLLRSEEFDNASWSKSDSTVTANSVTAPDGQSTADKLVENAANATHLVYAGTASLTAGQSYVVSVHIKAAERTWATIGSVTSGQGFSINLANGSTGAPGVPGWVSPTTTYGVMPLSNGWYRAWMRVASATGNNSLFDSLRVFVNNGTTTSYTGDGTSGIYIWGAQLEAGAFPTSYIPTTSSTVTRSADVASISGSNFSSWYRQDEGTVFADAISIATNTNVFSISDNTINNRIQLETGSSTRRFRITSSGTARYDNSVAYAFGTQGRSVGAYISSGSNHATNGVLGVNLAGSPLPVVDRIYIGSNAAGSLPNNGTIRRLTYWPTRLANTTLQEITQ